MKIKHTHKSQFSFALLELLLVAGVIIFLSYVALKAYFKNPPMDKPTQEALKEQGIDTSSQKAILDSTRERVGALSKQLSEQEKQLEDLDR